MGYQFDTARLQFLQRRFQHIHIQPGYDSPFYRHIAPGVLHLYRYLLSRRVTSYIQGTGSLRGKIVSKPHTIDIYIRPARTTDIQIQIKRIIVRHSQCIQPTVILLCKTVLHFIKIPFIFARNRI